MNSRPELVPISEARARLNDLITKSLPEREVMLLRHGRPVAVLIAPARYEELLDRIDMLEAELTAVAVRAGFEETVPWEKPKADAGLMAG